MQDTMGQGGYVSTPLCPPPILATKLSLLQGMFYMFGCFCLLMTLFAWYFIPETKGVSLEKMDELFGDAPHAAKADSEDSAEKAESIHEAAPEKQ